MHPPEQLPDLCQDSHSLERPTLLLGPGTSGVLMFAGLGLPSVPCSVVLSLPVLAWAHGYSHDQLLEGLCIVYTAGQDLTLFKGLSHLQ